MNSLITIFLSIFAGPAFADPRVVVKAFDPRLPVEQFQAQGIVVNDTSRESESSLPKVKDLEAMFAKAGVSSYVMKWDRLDRDMLALSAKTLTIEELAANYKTIPKDRLASLQILMK